MNYSARCALTLLASASLFIGCSIENAHNEEPADEHQDPLTAGPPAVVYAAGGGTDINGDGLSDVALVGGVGWSTLPVAYSTGSGFTITNPSVGDFAAWAAGTGVKSLAGDFNGDRRTDVALEGGAGWTTAPVAYSNGGGFTITNSSVGDFASWATTPGARLVGGDFDNDGRTDIALVGGVGWSTLPVAFSTGGGFNVTNPGVGAFASWATRTGARVVAGDFDGDGGTDIALVGGVGWTTVPVAYSTTGGFNVTNPSVGDFASWAAQPAVTVLAGDFNGDGRTDIALVGGAGWTTLPVAYAAGSGFNVTNPGVGDFGSWATALGAKPLAGDFNGDGRTDVALVGGVGWSTLPVAYSTGSGFNVTNPSVGDYASWATAPGAKPRTGDFNGDGLTDVALVGGVRWNTIPVAYSTGGGFNVTNPFVGDFASWATAPGATIVGR